jgi:small-conductance mechanosensitive channel
MSNSIDNTLSSIKSSFDYSALWDKLLDFLPNFFSAIVLLVVGYFLARIASGLINKLLVKVGFDKISEKAGLSNEDGSSKINASPSKIFGKIVYWLIFLVFISAASEKLGLAPISDMVNDFIKYLPKIVGALLVVLFGLFAAGLVRSGVETALSSLHLGYEKAVGNIIYAIIVIVVASLAINQLEIKTDLFNQVVVILLFAGASSVALALGLGTRDIAGNIVAGVYIREMCNEGDKVKVGDTVGTVIEVNSTSLLLKTEDDRKICIPNSRLIDEELEILS